LAAEVNNLSRNRIFSTGNPAHAAPAALFSLLNRWPFIVDRKRILLADDHAEFMENLCLMLGERYEIVGAVSDGKALAEAAQALDPDLIISDIGMPVMNGFEAASALRSLGLKSKLIFLTVHSAPAYIRRARTLGAQGYVSKLRAAEQLLPAISRVLDGDTFVSPELQPSW
jgi:DNA-binding NarL/FixJ family response regulator